MKTLHLMRHAKSSWDAPELEDRDRRLNRRGHRDAPRMGRALADRLLPMALHVSPARRAQLTLAGLCAGWGGLSTQPHTTVEALYTFRYDAVWHWIAACAEEHTALFILAHNPALTELVNRLVGRPVLDNLPTAGYVQLALAVEHWAGLESGCAKVADSLFPRQLSHS
tara:strand:+ start:4629 stop:5132 length:504 start_codon:yes stop_codon:yes gene_type:complete